jgi:hypothetical protein
MKRLTVALLVLALFTPAVFAQSVAQGQNDLRKVLSVWLGIVQTAEGNYKNKHGRYGDLAHLRKAHLLDGLVFESDSSTGRHDESQTNFVRKNTVFRVTVSEDGQHFRAVIGAVLGEDCWTLYADDRREVVGASRCRPSREFPLPPDGPEGPIIAIPG